MRILGVVGREKCCKREDVGGTKQADLFDVEVTQVRLPITMPTIQLETPIAFVSTHAEV